MKIIFAGHKERGVECLKALLNNNYDVVQVIAQNGSGSETLVDLAESIQIPVIRPGNVNDPKVIDRLKKLQADLVVLAGYCQIVKQPFINLAKSVVNLHGGKLPQYRGSSPMNWALITGEKEFTISIIKVDKGVDTGDVLTEKTFPISMHHTIDDLQKTANKEFPRMLTELIGKIKASTVKPRKQDESQAAYYPLRFPDDGLILFDLFSAEQVHNRIRALADPYPGAFTFFSGQKIKLLKSRLYDKKFFGEPGRVYRKSGRKLLICAIDHALWIEKAILEDTGEDASEIIARYDKLATLRDLAIPNVRTFL